MRPPRKEKWTLHMEQRVYHLHTKMLPKLEDSEVLYSRTSFHLVAPISQVQYMISDWKNPPPFMQSFSWRTMQVHTYIPFHKSIKEIVISIPWVISAYHINLFPGEQCRHTHIYLCVWHVSVKFIIFLFILILSYCIQKNASILHFCLPITNNACVCIHPCKWFRSVHKQKHKSWCRAGLSVWYKRNIMHVTT